MVKQKGPIPVFVKEDAGRRVWRYQGLMLCVSFNTDIELCSEEARRAGRTDKLAGVLTFEDTN